MPNHNHPTYGWGWRSKNRRLQRYVTVAMEDEVHGTLAEFSARLAAKAEAVGLVEAEVTTDTKYGSWGEDDRDVFALVGWRDATAEEIAEVKARRAVTLAHIEQRQHEEVDAAERLLRQARPDLFQ